jgi:hypothetical protein
VPPLTGWEVHSHGTDPDHPFPPLHSDWDPGLIGPGTLPALLLAGLAVWRAARWSATWSWGRLLAGVYVGSLAWMFALALVDGASGLSRTLGNPYEYLVTAREHAGDVPAFLDQFTSRIPYSAEDNWVTHVAGHPPGATLFFILLVRLGLGGDLTAAVVVTVLAATAAVAVMVALRALGAEEAARRTAPFLAFGPAAMFMSVSADAVFATFAAWGLAALALGATTARAGGRGWLGWSALAGLLLGACVMMSYGLPLLGTLAVAVLVAARAWQPLPVAAPTALLVVLAFVPFGFAWWEAYPVLTDRYWDGIASIRPGTYWTWANLAALCWSAGPVLGAGIARLVEVGRGAREVLGRPVTDQTRTVWLLVAGAATAIVVADLSQMSRAEVERIWLPFVPWLLVSVALLPPRWRRIGLLVQVVLALVHQHLFYTSW